MREIQEDFIDNYLQGRLSKLELERFKTQLENDKKFEANFRLRLASTMAIQTFFRNEIKAELQEWEEEALAPNPKIIALRRNKIVLAIAASLVLITLSVFVFLNFQKTNPHRLFTAYYQKYPNYVASVERGEKSSSTYTEAFRAYEQGDFSKAIALFEDLATGDTRDRRLIFYLGLSYLENKNYKKAKQALQNFSKSPSENFEEVARWYLALTYLKLDKIDRSKTLLKKIKQEKGDYAQKAVNLLNDL